MTGLIPQIPIALMVKRGGGGLLSIRLFSFCYEYVFLFLYYLKKNQTIAVCRVLINGKMNFVH